MIAERTDSHSTVTVRDVRMSRADDRVLSVDRRFAARVAEQERLHALDPERYSLLVPVDDEEFGTEAYTAGWADDEPDQQPDCDYDPATDHFLLDGKVVRPPHFSPEWGEAWEAWRDAHGLGEVIWEMATPHDGPSLWRLHHEEPEPGFITWFGDSDDAASTESDDLDDEHEGDWLSRIVFEPWALSGDLPEPEEVLSKYPDLADVPKWSIYEIGPEDGDISVAQTGLTLGEAEARI